MFASLTIINIFVLIIIVHHYLKVRKVERKWIYQKEEATFLIDSQIDLLRNQGCPIKVIEEIEKQRKEMIERVIGMSFRNDNLPILFVIPFNAWSYHSQARAICNRAENILGVKVEKEKRKNVDFLFRNGKTNERSRKKFYPIFDIEIGKRFISKNRLFLSLEETMAYALQMIDLLASDEIVSTRNCIGGRNLIFSLKINSRANLEIDKLDYEKSTELREGILTCRSEGYALL